MPLKGKIQSNKKIYIIKQYMLRIAGQTAGTIALKFSVDTHGWPGGGLKAKKKSK